MFVIDVFRKVASHSYVDRHEAEDEMIHLRHILTEYRFELREEPPDWEQREVTDTPGDKGGIADVSGQ